MQIRELDRADVARIWEIDRSETHDEVYVLRDGALELVPSHFAATGWHPATIEQDTPRLAAADVRLAALDSDRIVGVAVLEGERLFYLHVDAAYRGRGVGTRLFEEAASRSPRLLVSATPTRSTIDFYLARGCVLDPDPPADQVADEPDDIQLLYER
ncbi:MAG: GNAT family N-acetyltransferase [Actinomycetota bacterium]